MRLALYSIIFLGSVILGLDLMQEVKQMPEPEEPTPHKATNSSPSDQNPAASPSEMPDGHPDFKEALGIYTKAIEEAPDKADGYADRANAYIANHQPALAIVDFDQAIKLDPKNTDYLLQRGYLLFNLNQKEKALADFDKAIGIDSALTKAYVYRAMANFLSQSYQPALDDCLKILEQDPSFTDLHLTIAKCYDGLKQKDKALEHLELYINSSKDAQGIKEAQELKQSLQAPSP
ncbi:tetratricopeptide repeat protein [Verrucomicrobiaceae bacterium N1E253]|uniref:Tetratricopeptide repeat protein n=1 Tax=Oceaniferula marina TaxID=2748318 RepID=A0A851GAU8_9BACT|nr:tetratricopeptide repeat protein [Oceaniferula marina]NWK54888.1 tetratricopeptide repeat protein [Oceaniferula marina]